MERRLVQRAQRRRLADRIIGIAQFPQGPKSRLLNRGGRVLQELVREAHKRGVIPLIEVLQGLECRDVVQLAQPPLPPLQLLVHPPHRALVSALVHFVVHGLFWARG